MQQKTLPVFFSALGILLGLSLLVPLRSQAQYDPMRIPPPPEEIDGGVPPEDSYYEGEPLPEPLPPEAAPEPLPAPSAGTDPTRPSTQAPRDSTLRKNLWGPILD